MGIESVGEAPGDGLRGSKMPGYEDVEEKRWLHCLARRPVGGYLLRF
jgi:hypothetical protein